MSKLFECRKSYITVPCDKTPTKDNYMIDVWVYDDSLSNEFETAHYDPKFSYVAFVTFRDTGEPCIHWNIKSKYLYGDVLLGKVSREEFDRVYDNICNYEQQHSKEVIDIATQYFVHNYKNKYLL
jgi:hypothetical protein